VVHDVPANTTVVGIPAKPVEPRRKPDHQEAAASD
jgi:serine acetyltransferase